jgi:Tfp pilus assembly protein PilF
LAHYNRGTALKALERLRDAADAFRTAIRIAPKLAPAYANLGVTLQDLGDLAGAAEAYERALTLNPGERETLNNLGTLRREQGDLDGAADIFTKLIAAHADFGEAYLNFGSVRHAQQRFDDAIAILQQALARGARRDAAFYNIGLAHERKAEIAQAVASYEAAVAANPDNAEAQWNKALLHLMRGEFAAGWHGYEHRWRTRTLAGQERPHGQPRWDGRRDLAGALLVWGEQGIGDEILYGRMAGELADAGMNVVCELDPRLVPLFARSWPALRVIPRQTPPDPIAAGPDIAAQIPAASLGQYLRAEAGAFPTTAAGYVRPKPARVARYRDITHAQANNAVVGISWISKNPDVGANKTVPLSSWAPILKTPGITFVDLQYGDTAAERRDAEAQLGVSIQHLAELDLRQDIDGLAALIAACDVVVTVSNSTAHLAGALGVPVWVMVPGGHGKFWYWGMGDVAPWYPRARLFRQDAAAGWRATIDTVARELMQLQAHR